MYCLLEIKTIIIWGFCCVVSHLWNHLQLSSNCRLFSLLLMRISACMVRWHWQSIKTALQSTCVGSGTASQLQAVPFSVVTKMYISWCQCRLAKGKKMGKSNVRLERRQIVYGKVWQLSCVGSRGKVNVLRRVNVWTIVLCWRCYEASATNVPRVHEESSPVVLP